MLTVAKSILIDCSLEEVFEFISNFKNDTQWRKGVIEMLQFPDYGVFVGATTIETIKLFGQRHFISAEIIEFEKNNKVSFKTTDGIFEVAGYRKVERENNKTKFTYSLSANLKGIYKMFSKIIKINYEKRIEKDLRKLKSILERND